MNICIIGFGEIGKKYFSVLNLNQKVNIYIVDKKKFSIKKKNIYTCTNIADLPKSIFYSLIIICTPLEARYDVFQKIINLKVNKIISEKPVSKSVKDFKKILFLMKNKNIDIYTNYIRQFLKEFLQIKKIILNEKYGKSKVATFYYSKGVFHNGVHFIDYAISLFGMPTKVKIISKIKSQTFKNDYLIDFILIYKKLKIYFISFETKNVSSSNFEIILENGKIEVTTDRELKIYNINKNTVVQNINQFSLVKKEKINYENSFKNLLLHVLNPKHKKYEKIKYGFRTNDKKVYAILNKMT